MRRTLLLLHLLSAIGLLGAIACQLAIATVVPEAAAQLAGLRQSVATASARIVLPALALMTVSGLLLIAARPELLERRWVLAKAGLGMALAGLVWLPLGAAVKTVLTFALQDRLTPAEQALLAQALRSELQLAWAALVLGALAAALAVWRPRLGQRPEAAGPT